jgi:peptidoglycan-N-acetylglucosamine deacetylase
MDSPLRIRWDRVSLLAVALAVGLVLAGYGIFRAPDRGHAGSTTLQVHPVAPASLATPRACPPPRSPVVRSAPRRGDSPTVALTFDDGPSPWTDQALAVLARENVHATFFVVGRLAKATPERITKAVAAGHAVENHSWSHPSPPRSGWNRRVVRSQIRRANAALSDILGHQPCFFRPPEGVAEGAHEETRAAGMSIALWSVDTRDWATHGPSAAARIRSRAAAGLKQRHPIVLMHDGGGNRDATMAALPGIIEDYRRQGYEFVTLEDPPS